MNSLFKTVGTALLLLGVSAYGADNFKQLMAKAKTAEKSRNYAAALTSLDQAVKAATTPADKQQALGKIGDIKVNTRDYAGAVAAYKAAGAIPNKRAWISYRYQRQAGFTLSRYMRKYSEAFDLLRDVTKKEAESGALFYAVEAGIYAKRLDEAQKLLNYGRAQDSSSRYFLYDLCLSAANLKIARKDYAGAIKEYENIAKLNGVTAQEISKMYGYIAGVYLWNVRDKQKAREYYQKCASYNFDNWHVRNAKKWLKNNPAK